MRKLEAERRDLRKGTAPSRGEPEKNGRKKPQAPKPSTALGFLGFRVFEGLV